MDMRQDEFTVTVDDCEEINYVGWAHCFRYALLAHTYVISYKSCRYRSQFKGTNATSDLYSMLLSCKCLRPVTYQL